MIPTAIRAFRAELRTTAAIALLAALALLPGGAALACDPPVADGPVSPEKAQLAARVAELRAQIDALERQLAAPTIRRSAAPAVRPDAAPTVEPIRRRARLSREGATPSPERAARGRDVRVFRLDTGPVPSAPRVAPAMPAPLAACRCHCSCRSEAGGAVPSPAPAVRWRVAPPRSSGGEVRLRSSIPGDPRARGALRGAVLPRVPGEMRVILERSPPARPCSPGSGEGGSRTPPPPPEHPEPFGVLPGTGAGRTAVELPVRLLAPPPAPLLGASGGSESPRRGGPAGAGTTVEYY